jgi:hypothetical protein
MNFCQLCNLNAGRRRQRLLSAQRLRNQLADYFLTPAGAIPSQSSDINWIQPKIEEDEE